MYPMYGAPKPFSDTCHGHRNIPLTVEGPLDVARRLVGCMFGLKTALAHLKFQVNWVHKKGFVLLFHMRYSKLLTGQKWQGGN